jgi:hypothetical protein
MATLQAGEKARMYALGKIARGGATRGGYVSARAFIAIDGVHVGFGGTPGAGHVGTIITSLSITDALNEAANTCQFRVNGMVPAAGAQVKITLGSKNSTGALFAGFALHVEQGYAADKPANLNADVSAVDYTWLLGFTKVTKAYRNLSASAIAADLVATYAAANGFTSYAVAPSLPTITEITYTNEELDQAMTRLAERIGGYWYVDYQKDIHFFIDETLNGAPEVLTPQHKSLDNVRKTADRTQVLTRVYVEGRGSNILGAVKAGDTLIPIEAVDMFEAAADVFAKISPHGSEGAAEWVSYTGVIPGGAGSLVGPGVGPPGAPAVGRAAGAGLGVGTYKYAYTDVTPSGETLPSPLAVIDVGAPIPAPTLPPTVSALAASSGVDIGSHAYAYSYTTPTGETVGGPATPTAVSTQGLLIPTGGISGQGQTGTARTPFPPYTYFPYKVTYIGNAGGETTAAPYDVSGNVTGCQNCAMQLSIGGDANGSPWAAVPAGVAQVKVYRSRQGYQNGWDPASLQFGYVGNATPPTGNNPYWYFVDYYDVTPGAAIPTTNAAQIARRKIHVITDASPDAAVTGVKIYRSRVDIPGTPYKLVAAVAGALGAVTYDDVIPDASLGATAPLTNTTGDAYRAVAVSNIAPGPSPTTARNVYRTAVNGSQLKRSGTFADNTSTAYTDTVPDASLGVNAPTADTSGLAQVPGQVPAGAPAILVANVGPFEAGGGWAVIGNGEQVIRYLAKSGTTLTGIPSTGIGAIVAAIAFNSTITAAPMLTGIPASGPYAIVEDLNPGDEINLVARREDASRQTALAAMIKTGPGWREEWIQDRRLSIAEARARGDATLALRPLEDVTIAYTCRDLRTASGKSITVNLPAPTNISGTFKIQTVTIANFRPFPTQYPTFAVTASSSRFSFEDWLRQMQTKV